MDPIHNPYAPPLASSVEAGPTDATGAPAFGAGMGIRFGARAIDRLVGLLPGAFVSNVAMGAIAALLGPRHRAPRTSDILLQLALAFPGPALYHAISDSVGGAGIGKVLCGLRVVTRSGAPASFLACVKREAILFVDLFCFGIVAYTFMSRDAREQRLGDRWAGTMVVQRSEYPAISPRSPALGIALGLSAWACVSVLTAIVGYFS